MKMSQNKYHDLKKKKIKNEFIINHLTLLLKK